MNPVTITFAPDGTAQCLWTELFPLHELGRLHVTRATTIEFDNHSQAWRVYDPKGHLMYSSPSREVCLAWEQKHLNWVMENS